MSYLSEAIGYFSISLKYGTLFFLVLYFCKIRKWNKNVFDVMLYYIFIIYVFTVFAVTRVISGYAWKLNTGSFAGFSFSELFSMEKLLNAVLFLPLGIFLPYLIKKHKWYVYVFIGFSSSVFIECIQYFFVGRLADATDVFANTCGCAFGLLAGCLWNRVYTAYWNHKQAGPGTLSFAFNLVLLFLSLPLFMGKLCLGDFLVGNLLGYKFIWSACNPHYMEFSGIHYTIIYIFIFACGSFGFCKKYSDDLFAKAAEKTSVLLLVCLPLLLFFQMF